MTTNSPTNTNQASEDELRAEILTEFKQVHKLAPADYTENCTNIVMSISTTEPRDLNVKETPSTAKPKRGRPTEIKRDITKTSQSGLREGLTRATFIIREDTLDRLKQRAYDDRKKLKDIVTEALDYYLDKTKTDKGDK